MKGEVMFVPFTNCEEMKTLDLFVAVDYGVYQRYVNLLLEQLRKECGLRNYKDTIQEDKFYVLSITDLIACDQIRGINELKRRFPENTSIILVKGDAIEELLGPMGENYVIVEEKYYIERTSIGTLIELCAKNCMKPYDRAVWEMTLAQTAIMKETIEYLRRCNRFTLVQSRDLYKKTDKQLQELYMSVKSSFAEEELERVKAESILRSTFGDNYDFLMSDDCQKLMSIVKNK